MTCVFIDSGREETNLKRSVFDSSDLCTDLFCNLLKRLMEWTNEESIYFTVLSPDPVLYYKDRFNIYPCIEVGKEDLPDNFLSALNKPLVGDSGETLGIVYKTYVIAPSSLNWFVHALRSGGDRGGHLWIPSMLGSKMAKSNDIFLEGVSDLTSFENAINAASLEIGRAYRISSKIFEEEDLEVSRRELDKVLETLHAKILRLTSKISH